MYDLKKLSLSFIALISASAFAGSMGSVVTKADMREGFYVGAGIGGGMYSDKITASDPSTVSSVNTSIGTSSALASIFAGIGRTYFDKYYLGAEANSYFPGHSSIWQDRPGVTVQNYTYQNEFQVRNYVNLDLLPGYRIHPDWLVYGRVGLSFSQIVANQEANRLASVYSYSSTHDFTGGRFGAGVAYQLTEHVGAAVDYYYSYIPTSSFSFNDKTRTTVLQLDDRLNYVGFSLFYTI